MTKYDIDLLIYIGRFQPFHCGHLYVLMEALKKAEKVIVMIGSANQPRSHHNRWLWQERESMIRSCLDEGTNHRVVCMPLEDVPSTVANCDEIWVNNVKGIAKSVTDQYGSSKDRISLIGFQKDSSSFYLRLFPEWGLMNIDSYREISATPIRNGIYSAENPSSYIDGLVESGILPSSVAHYLIQNIELGNLSID